MGNSRVESEGTLWSERSQQPREGDGEDRGPEQAGRNSPAHSYLTM
jgi:hypothetical protein